MLFTVSAPPVGPAESGVTVNDPVAVLAALSVTVIVRKPLSLAPVVHVYTCWYGPTASAVGVVGVIPFASPGNVTDCTPDWPSVAVEATVKVPPAPPGR